MDLVMDSAFALSSSDVTLPPRVTTPLSRSWLTVTLLRPACSIEVRTSPVTSAALLKLEHPARVATIATAKRDQYGLSVFIFFSFDYDTISIFGGMGRAERRVVQNFRAAIRQKPTGAAHH